MRSMESTESMQNAVRMKSKRSKRILAFAAFVIGISILFMGCTTDVKEQTPAAKDFVKAGTWIHTEKKAEADGKAHPMKYKITSIVRNTKKVRAAIDAYNLDATGNVIGELKSDQVEFCMANYLAYYPKGFPQQQFGITDVSIPFEIVSLSGGDIQVGDTVYKSLSTTWEIGALPQGYDFHAGDKYHGKIIFVMVKGYKDYLIHQLPTTKKSDKEIYIRGK